MLCSIAHCNLCTDCEVLVACSVTVACAPGALEQERLLSWDAVDDQPAAAHLHRVASRRDHALDEHLLVLQWEPASASAALHQACHAAALMPLDCWHAARGAG